MNATQKLIFLVGILAICTMGLYPPWKVAGPKGLPIEYGSIYAPPVPKDAQKAQEGIEIDFKRLLLAMAVAAISTGGFIKIASSKEEITKVGAGSIAESESQPVSNIQDVDDEEDEDDEEEEIHHVEETKSSSAHTIKLNLPKGKVYGEFLVEADDDPDSWEWFADAKGKVELPTNKPVQLEVTEKEHVDLSFLTLLREDTLHSIDLTNCQVKDWELSNLTKLSGLKELDLTGTTITSEALSYVGNLEHLEKLWLDGTKIDDQSISSLNKLIKLKKLSVKKTKLTESGIKELKSALDKCTVEA